MQATPPPGSTPASRQFQAEPRGDARIFCAIGGAAVALKGSLRILGILYARALLRIARLGILPSLGAANSRPLFFCGSSFAAGCKLTAAPRRHYHRLQLRRSP